ncbi:ribulose-phosphate 3-epimerase [Nitrospira sp. T9]|uniref:ribulose-phosphate 3-epimerase n=1 Tax=unclassified Nitrospira TaxID=2652172 RepID=UPI003F95A6DD
MPVTPLISPSILSADFARLAEAVQMVEAAGADWIHVDVMDGHFVPNLTVGPPMVEALRKVTSLPLDVHLMMTNPDDFISEFVDAGADLLTVHVEACPHLHRTVQSIKERQVKAGVSLNPATSVTSLEEILGEVDLVLVMSVNPGFGGQQFISSSLDKIRRIRTMMNNSRSSAHLEVDGGINPTNVASVIQAGANVLVAGSAIFGSKNIPETIRQMRTAAQTVIV